MTNRTNRESLQVQLAETENLLNLVGDHPIMSFSLKQKIQSIRQEIENIPVGGKEAKIDLFFTGKPIIGSQGLDAYFAGKVLQPFQNMVMTDFAHRAHGKSGRRGKAAYAKESQLFITSLPRGSFGLELTKLQNHSLFDEMQLADTLEEITNLIAASATSDDVFAEAIEKTTPRTIKGLEDFLKVISEEDAGIKVETGDVYCNLTPEQARIAYDRVSDTTIDDNIITIEGTLRGVLLDSWRFDFVPTEGDKFSGRLSDDITEETASLYLGEFVNKKCNATFEIYTIEFKNGRSKSSHILLEIQ